MTDKLTLSSLKHALIKRGWTLRIDRTFTVIVEKGDTLIELGATSSYTVDTGNTKLIALYEDTEIRGDKLLVLTPRTQYQCVIGDEMTEKKTRSKKEVKE